MRERYIFTGKFVLDTGLHVGSGKGSEKTDATVIKDSNDRLFIPGSSLKGAMRSTVEQISQALPNDKVESCLLFEESSSLQCVTSNSSVRDRYEEMRERGDSEAALLKYLLGYPVNKKPPHLCNVCRVFGSPYYASKVRIADLFALNCNGDDTEVRDGVGIDRDTETAREKIKFDFEVAPPKVEFAFEMIVEDPVQKDLGVVCIGLRELQLGGIRIGGIKSRGLGKCHLLLDEKTIKVNLADPVKLFNYLTQSQIDVETGIVKVKGEELVTESLIEKELKRLLC